MRVKRSLVECFQHFLKHTSSDTIKGDVSSATKPSCSAGKKYNKQAPDVGLYSEDKQSHWMPIHCWSQSWTEVAVPLPSRSSLGPTMRPRCWQIAPSGGGTTAITPSVQVGAAAVVAECFADVVEVAFIELLREVTLDVEEDLTDEDLGVVLIVLDVVRDCVGTLMVVFHACQSRCSKTRLMCTSAHR